MKEKEDENIVKELVFDEEGKEVQEDIVEELTTEEKEKIIGGATYKLRGTKYEHIKLKYNGHSKFFTAGLGFWDFLRITKGRTLVKANGFLGGIKITRKSSKVGIAKVEYAEYHKSFAGNYYYNVIVSIVCP